MVSSSLPSDFSSLSDTNWIPQDSFYGIIEYLSLLADRYFCSLKFSGRENVVELVMTWPIVKCLVENRLCDPKGLNVRSLSKRIYWLLLLSFILAWG